MAYGIGRSGLTERQRGLPMRAAIRPLHTLPETAGNQMRIAREVIGGTYHPSNDPPRLQILHNRVCVARTGPGLDGALDFIFAHAPPARGAESTVRGQIRPGDGITQPAPHRIVGDRDMNETIVPGAAKAVLRHITRMT